MSESTLTKAALVEQVADAAGLTTKRAKIIIDTLFGSIGIGESLLHFTEIPTHPQGHPSHAEPKCAGRR